MLTLFPPTAVGAQSMRGIPNGFASQQAVQNRSASGLLPERKQQTRRHLLSRAYIVFCILKTYSCHWRKLGVRCWNTNWRPGKYKIWQYRDDEFCTNNWRITISSTSRLIVSCYFYFFVFPCFLKYISCFMSLRKFGDTHYRRRSVLTAI